ncbi:TnsD family transposase [Pseudomonas cichorii]|nr:TnsD family transposase [Pseudomonas cichorii]MBX8596770.1 TnsD family transposase [Pseudomonas cichorii]
MSTIFFFPPSMPDETLHSRVSRYHFLSGNRTEKDTFSDLFGTTPFSFYILPSQLNTLAERLPGDSECNRQELIEANTLFPAYRPFSGIAADSVITSRHTGVARVPRREGAAHEKGKVCLSCIQEDMLNFGHAYLHRAHQLPGVSACWQHGVALSNACPKCSHPFMRGTKLLANFIDDCMCGWNALAPVNVNEAGEAEKSYASFAYELLQLNLPATSWRTLSACYRRQAVKCGYGRGTRINTAKLIGSIEHTYGEDVLSRIDKAYAAGKRHQWLRTSTTRGQIDMPLARHILLSHYLFTDASQLKLRLEEEALLEGCSRSPVSVKDKPSASSKRSLHRGKIRRLLEAKSSIGLNYLWEHQYAATRWLTEHDKAWFQDALSGVKRPVALPALAVDLRDPGYADLISNGVDELYRISKDQKRVNIKNIMGLIPKAIPLSPSLRKERFPLVSQQLELHLESRWHYMLRRGIWAISEIARLGHPPNSTSFLLFTSTPWAAWQAIMNFFEWNMDELTSTSVDMEELLKSTGVTRQWSGPPGYDLLMSGHAYQEKMQAQREKLPS